MAEKIQFDLVSPERLLLSLGVDMVIVPGAEGDFGALPGHAPLISTMRPGVVEVFNEGAERERIFVAGGFAEVTPERCTVLAEEAVPLAGVDRQSVEADLRLAREDVSDADTHAERAAAEKRVARGEALLTAIESRPYG